VDEKPPEMLAGTRFPRTEDNWLNTMLRQIAEYADVYLCDEDIARMQSKFRIGEVEADNLRHRAATLERAIWANLMHLFQRAEVSSRTVPLGVFDAGCNLRLDLSFSPLSGPNTAGRVEVRIPAEEGTLRDDADCEDGCCWHWDRFAGHFSAEEFEAIGMAFLQGAALARIFPWQTRS
jgi:hypothetical protein